MKKTKMYVWYSPKIDHIRLAPFGECTEYKSCTWETCPVYWYRPTVKARPKKPRIDYMTVYYYIGEL